MADLHAPRLPLDVLEVVGREVTDSFDRRPSNELYTTLVALSSVSTYFRQVVSPCLFDTLVCFGSSHATKLLRILQSPHSTLSPYVLDFELRLPPGWVDVEELPQIFDTLSNLQSLSIDCSTPQKTTISESLRLSLGRIVASGRIQDLSLTGLIDVSCILDSLHPAVHSLTLHGCFSEPSPSPEALQIMENQGILVPKVSTLTLCRSDPCVRRMLAAGQLQNLQDIVVLYGPSCDPSTLNLVVDGCSKTLQKITLGMKALYGEFPLTNSPSMINDWYTRDDRLRSFLAKPSIYEHRWVTLPPSGTPICLPHLWPRLPLLHLSIFVGSHGCVENRDVDCEGGGQ